METTTIDYLNSVDTELFYWINQHHCTVADYVLYAFTQHWSWMVMIVLFFAVAVVKAPEKRWWWEICPWISSWAPAQGQRPWG